MTAKPAAFVTASGSPARRRVTAWFMAQHAISPGDAIPYSPVRPEEREAFETMLARGIVKRAAQGCFWLDTVAYTRDDRDRQARIGAIAAVLAVIAAIGLMFLY